MADHVDVAVLDRAEQAVGGLVGVLRQGEMGAGDDVVQFRQDLVFIVELAVGEDVDLGAGQQRDLPLKLVVRLCGWPRRA